MVGWGPEHDCFRRNIAKPAAPPCAAPVADAFLQIDFCALRDALYDSGLAAWPVAHRNRRAAHRQFRECCRRKGDENLTANTETHNHSHLVAHLAQSLASLARYASH